MTASDLAKFLMKTSATAKTKPAKAIINFTVAWTFVLKVSRNFKSKASDLVLDLFTWSVIFYDVGFFLKEKIFLSINITCYIFLLFPF